VQLARAEQASWRTAAIGTSPRDAAAYHLRAQAYADENEDALALADLDVVDQLGGDGPPKGSLCQPAGDTGDGCLFSFHGQRPVRTWRGLHRPHSPALLL